jgi:hypothetical protein
MSNKSSIFIIKIILNDFKIFLSQFINFRKELFHFKSSCYLESEKRFKVIFKKYLYNKLIKAYEMNNIY